MPYKFIEEIKSKLTKKILWISYYGVPRRGEFLSFDQYDFYLTGFRELESELNNENQISFFFPHYFATEYCEKEFKRKNYSKFTFVGSLTYKYEDHGFSSRRRLVEQLMDECLLEVHSQLNSDLNDRTEAIRQRLCSLRYELYHLLNSSPAPLHLLRNLPFLKRVKDWEVQPTPDYFFNPRLMQKVFSPKFGKKMYKILHDSLITFNAHGQVDANHGKTKFAAGNIRLFEATGAGCCLLTDHLPHLEEFFLPDEEIVTYKNKFEAVERAKYLQNNPKSAESIARRGHAKAWKFHTSEKRALEFSEIIKKYV